MTPSPAPVSTWATLLAQIHAQAFPPTHRWDAQAMQALLDMPGVSVVMAEGDAPAFIMVRTVFDEAEILTFAVDPAWQRRGIGRDLLARCMRQVEQAGARTLFLEVARDNAPAIALYCTSGFVQAGMRRNYYPDGMDACVMRREI
ncbi:ribosomal protein S18-alanine N-acetyltransferase [Komagataeibacter intermedius]|uniref:[Ribosomal protein bS18]-alanine N-acetyltransferase n=2 Tax=Komagataeibacter intermedius TaxID=66229 RepID=A0A0N1FJK2_9PROT|nr:ribosomal protein S18-alanine N-acetyltransferase [Komagataeibacter intermedius]KPH85960.1 alanine acetyltransferase [Komagataeibacter intermedius AF2]MCF3635731.1 ribosomal protein S18-alanine N-acetyltransferase [Komagataeibacter intermedius]GAN88125.1 ribosomal protein alanine acetyltransferase [Komagataeibacter intermedius TF2]GBQ71051.1 ribosomal protein alanine acetyltransferase [Komagataeibacter intermedius NRIC 0521]